MLPDLTSALDRYFDLAEHLVPRVSLLAFLALALYRLVLDESSLQANRFFAARAKSRVWTLLFGRKQKLTQLCQRCPKFLDKDDRREIKAARPR